MGGRLIMANTPKYGLYQWDSGDQKQITIDSMAENAQKVEDILTGFENDINSLNENKMERLQKEWIPLELQNGFTAYGSNYETPSYRINEVGDVQVKGLIRCPENVENTTVIAVLPEGYRPPKSKVYLVSGNSGGAKDVFTRVNITSGGNISYMTGGTHFLSLDDIPPFEAVKS